MDEKNVIHATELYLALQKKKKSEDMAFAAMSGPGSGVQSDSERQILTVFFL